ncbi:MAG: family 78 glycoside hydrolase catalytic domain, partial [Candidatus Omnitrophica bacterium]|nr:family 78 glycoside hydrolase catalytic domain [Candidatus Omnitrophota bacterium]
MAGWVRLKLNGTGHRGQCVQIRFSSLLEPDGTIAPKAFAHREQKF